MMKEEIAKEATNAVIASDALKVGYVGSGLAFFGGISATDFAAFAGLLVAVFGFAVNWYYKHLENNRAKLLHTAQMQEWDGIHERRGQNRRRDATNE